MTLAECRPGRKVRFADAKRLVYEGWILCVSPQRTHAGASSSWRPWINDLAHASHLTMQCAPSFCGLSPDPQHITVQYWSSLRCAWLTEQFTPEQLTPAPELATDDVPGRPA